VESRKSTAWFKKERNLGDSREHIHKLIVIILFKVQTRSYGEVKKILLEKPEMVELFL
jgi:hypothetical protein